MATKTKSKSKTKPKAKGKPAARPSPPKPAAKPALRPAAKAAPASKPAAGKPGAAAKPKAAPAAPALSTAGQQASLGNMKRFFERTLACLEEADSGFAPVAGMFSVAQQVAHAAQTVDWFLEGAFSPSGFNMDFPGLEGEVRKVGSLAQAKRWLDEAFGRLEKALRSRPPGEWFAAIVPNTIMGGLPRIVIVDGLADHTAHHRGALAVYARLRGKTPAMPYM